MGIVIEKINIYDEFTGEGGGGTQELNGNTGNKMTAWIDFYSYRAAEDKFLRFTGADKTIENINELDFTSFIDLGFKKGMIIGVVGSDSNNGAYTLDVVEAKKFTVVESLTDEDKDGVDVFDDTPVDKIFFLYNLIENNERENYLSKTDTGAVQRFVADNLDLYASDAEPNNMKVASSSFGWVTNAITDTATGETSEVTIEGMGISDHRQSFRIKQIFRIAPFGTAANLLNFLNNTLPSAFQDDNALKYICRLDAINTTEDDLAEQVIHTGSKTDASGISTWYDQNNIHSMPEYYIESVGYKDVNGVSLDAIDINKIVDVTMIVRSRNSKFDNDTGDTKFVLDFFYLPLAQADFINTGIKTLLQNFVNDRQMIAIDGGEEDGENNGSDYQVLQDINTQLDGTDTVIITFKVNFAEALKTFFKARDLENRKYFFTVTTQDITITETAQSDRIAARTELNGIAWDKSNPDILEAVDNLRAYMFPDIDANEKNSVAGYEGDPIAVQFPFRVESKGYYLEGVGSNSLSITGPSEEDEMDIDLDALDLIAGHRYRATVHISGVVGDTVCTISYGDQSDSFTPSAGSSTRIFSFIALDPSPDLIVDLEAPDADSGISAQVNQGDIVDNDAITPTIMTAGFEIVAKSPSGQIADDFVLESKLFDTSLVRKLLGVQTIDITQDGQRQDMQDIYNQAFLKRDESFDDGDMKGFLASYGFALRYDFWNLLIQDAVRLGFPIFADIESPTNAWNTLQQNGWELNVRFVATVKNYDDYVDTFHHYWAIDCKALGDAPDDGPTFTITKKFVDIETALETGGITVGKKTKITYIFTGDTSDLPDGMDSFWGYLFVDLEGGPGLSRRRFCSTEFDVADSPFAAGEEDPIADFSKASDNLVINIYADRVELITIFDDTVNKWGINNFKRIIPFPRIGLISRGSETESNIYYYL